MANFRFLKWCRQAVSRIVLMQDRITVEQELMGHLEDRYDYFTQQGYSADDAEMLSLDSMGSPEAIARELGLIHRPFWGRTARVTQILLTFALILAALTGGFSLLKNFYFRPAFSSPVYGSYHPYDDTQAFFQTGQAHRLAYTAPNVSFSSDGYTVTATKAALWHRVPYDTANAEEELHPVYIQLKIQNPRIWAGEDDISRWIWAKDNNGNQYPAIYESAPDTNHIRVKSYRISPWVSIHELEITDSSADGTNWIDLHYSRGSREHTLRIDLSGGQ